MCGIIAITGAHDATTVLLDGLRRLEYRGYDSAGLAVVDESQITVYKEVGPVPRLVAAVPADLGGRTGMAHTRWATHGGVTRDNAHPHLDPSGRVAVIHNGILDDARRLRQALLDAGVALRSETDTEVLACRIAAHLPGDPVAAVRAALRGLRGTWGLVVAFADHPELLVAARMGSPLCVGLGDEVTLVASDPAALSAYATRVIFLEDGDLAALRPGHAVVQHGDGAAAAPAVHHLDPADYTRAALGDHASWMAQEMAEQPEVLARGLAGRLRPEEGLARLGGLDLSPREIALLPGAVLLGCGTSLHAAEVGALLLQRLARLPARAEPASEYAASGALVDPQALHLALSQSGETWDTLAAVREVQRHGGRVFGLVNAVGSTLARLCGAGTHLHAGPEVSVASTKAFTSQVLALSLYALALGRTRHLSAEEARTFAAALARTPALVGQALDRLEADPRLAEATARVAGAPHCVFIGRGLSWAVAREGAWKMEELSWRPTRACAAGELKHGPLAVVGPGVPVIAVIPPDEHRQAMRSTLHEVSARGAMVIAVHAAPDEELAAEVDLSLCVPAPPHPLLSPLLTVLPLQRLAHDLAVALGREVDRPRNLAKAVTVA